jgi:hypothetical protein
MVQLEHLECFPTRFGERWRCGRGERVNKVMGRFGWENISDGWGSEKGIRVGTNIDFSNFRDSGGIEQEMQEILPPGRQDMVGECIRSEMAKGWLEGMEGNLAIGVKNGTIGIHGEDHIGRLELLWGIKQVLADMIGRVALMPFQIQEPNVREEDKKLPYLMYFCWKRETHKLLWLESSFNPSFDIRDKFTYFIVWIQGHPDLLANIRISKIWVRGCGFYPWGSSTINF